MPTEAGFDRVRRTMPSTGDVEVVPGDSDVSDASAYVSGGA
jgi:hypothetical protein